MFSKKIPIGGINVTRWRLDEAFGPTFAVFRVFFWTSRGVSMRQFLQTLTGSELMFRYFGCLFHKWMQKLEVPRSVFLELFEVFAKSWRLEGAVGSIQWHWKATSWALRDAEKKRKQYEFSQWSQFPYWCRLDHHHWHRSYTSRSWKNDFSEVPGDVQKTTSKSCFRTPQSTAALFSTSRFRDVSFQSSRECRHRRFGAEAISTSGSTDTKGWLRWGNATTFSMFFPGSSRSLEARFSKHLSEFNGPVFPSSPTVLPLPRPLWVPPLFYPHQHSRLWNCQLSRFPNQSLMPFYFPPCLVNVPIFQEFGEAEKKEMVCLWYNNCYLMGREKRYRWSFLLDGVAVEAKR